VDITYTEALAVKVEEAPKKIVRPGGKISPAGGSLGRT
jgi:hypothetical protein